MQSPSFARDCRKQSTSAVFQARADSISARFWARPTGKPIRQRNVRQGVANPCPQGVVAPRPQQFHRTKPARTPQAPAQQHRGQFLTPTALLQQNFDKYVRGATKPHHLDDANREMSQAGLMTPLTVDAKISRGEFACRGLQVLLSPHPFGPRTIHRLMRQVFYLPH